MAEQTQLKSHCDSVAGEQTQRESLSPRGGCELRRPVSKESLWSDGLSDGLSDGGEGCSREGRGGWGGG